MRQVGFRSIDRALAAGDESPLTGTTGAIRSLHCLQQRAPSPRDCVGFAHDRCPLRGCGFARMGPDGPSALAIRRDAICASRYITKAY